MGASLPRRKSWHSLIFYQVFPHSTFYIISSPSPFHPGLAVDSGQSAKMKTTWKDIQPVPTSAEFLDIVLSRTQRRLPTQIRAGFKISRIRSTSDTLCLEMYRRVNLTLSPQASILVRSSTRRRHFVRSCLLSSTAFRSCKTFIRSVRDTPGSGHVRSTH